MYPYPQSGQMQPSGPPHMQPYPAQMPQAYPAQHPHMYPYYPQEPLYHPEPQLHHLKNETLRTVEPFVQHGLKEAQHTSYPHAFREVAAITYLIGRGYDPRRAHQIVESWEVNEHF